MNPKLKIEIFADIICPWCYIGKKRLEKALSERPDIEVTIEWKGFLLNPSIPQYGIDRRQYLLTKFGHAASSIYSRIEQAGKLSGIDFDFDYLTRTNMTINSKDQAAFASKVAADLFGEDKVDGNCDPKLFSEDFAQMLMVKPGCYILIGNGTEGTHGQSLHSSNYDFNDKLLVIGSSFWSKLVEERLND